MCVNHQNTGDAVLLHHFGRLDGQCAWQYRARVGVHGLARGQGAHVNAFFNQAAQVTVGEDAQDFVLRIDNGRPIWNESLIGARADVRAFGNLADIRGRPVIDRGLVIAMGSAGQIAGIDLRSGQRQWDRNIGGSQTPW